MAKRSLQPITLGVGTAPRPAGLAPGLATAAGFAPGPLGRVAAQAQPLQDRPPYLDPARPLEARVEDLLARLTLEEKVGLVHANGKFRAGGVERLGVPHLWTADGPQGVREEVGIDSWEPAGWTSDFATAMPVGMALASTWDTELAEAYGRVVGDEARARGKHVILGPALNIQRTPLCGRTYDYFGEDPWLAGRMTVGYVKGMQAEQTIACIKHYAANNQEKDRGSIDVQVAERPLREIYLPAFEAGVREGGALAVMAAYNKLRGEHAGHNDYLLNQVLKREWGFTGGVISDWGGTHDTREAVLKGLDLEMGTGKPYDQYYLAGPFLAGLKDGTFPVSVLDDKVRRNLRMLIASGGLDGRRPGTINTKAHQDVALRVARDGIVLLKNEPSVLPLDLAKLKTIAVIGDNAVLRFAAGGNAAGVKAFHEITALDGIVARVGGRADVVFSQGYRQPARRGFGQRDVAGVRTSDLTAASPEEAKELGDRAVETARRADAVVFVGGLTHQSGADDEGADRRDLSLSAHQDELIARIVEANPRTAVVLIAGSPVDMTALAREDAGRAPGLVRRLGGRPRARLGRLRRRQPVRQAPLHLPEVARRLPRPRRGPRPPVPRRGRQGLVRRGPPGRLPLERREGDRAALPLRPRPELHALPVRGAAAEAHGGPGRPERHAGAPGHEHRRARGRRDRPGVRAAGEAPGHAAREGAEGLREGPAEAGRDEDRHPRPRPARLRLLRPRGEGLAGRQGPLRAARRRQLARHPPHRQRGVAQAALLK